MLAAQWHARFAEIKGYAVFDVDGRRMGRAVGLLLSPEDGSVYLRVARSRVARGRLVPWELLDVADDAATIAISCPAAHITAAPAVADVRQLSIAEHEALRRHYGLPLVRQAARRSPLRGPAAALAQAGERLVEGPAYAWWRLRRAELPGRARWRLSLAARRLDDLRWAFWDRLRPPRLPRRTHARELPGWSTPPAVGEQREADA